MRALSPACVPFRMLDIQYRMHPDICRIARKTAYAGRLSSADATKRRPVIHGLPWKTRKRFIWYNVFGWETGEGRAGDDGSFRNVMEAHTILDLVESIHTYCPNLSFGLLGMYNAQVDELRSGIAWYHTRRRLASFRLRKSA